MLRRRAIAAALAISTGLGACDSTAPLPAGAASLSLPPTYSVWWSMVEKCAGRTRPMAQIGWYAVPGWNFNDSKGNAVQGLFRNGPDDVILAADHLTDGPTVRHEMLHAILDSRTGPRHSAEFMGSCRGTVVCNRACRASAEVPDYLATAKAVEPSALVIGLEGDTVVSLSRLPTPYTSIVVTARNPTSDLVAVRLPGSYFSGYATFGISVTGPEIWSGQSKYATDADSVDRYFLPGETKRFVFDIFFSSSPGQWSAAGYFANHKAPTAFLFRVVP